MKMFHISDVLSVTTGRLVSSRHIDGVYDVLNFLTGDNLYTHQLPRAMDKCKPWLRSMFPALMEDSPGMPERLADMDRRIKAVQQDREHIGVAIGDWVEHLRLALGLPEMLAVYELGADMHTRIDPIEEARAMVGDDRVLTVNFDEPRDSCI
jgi:hypothetical protein